MAVVSGGGRRLHLLHVNPVDSGVTIVERYSREVCASQMSSLSLLTLPAEVKPKDGDDVKEQSCTESEMYIAVGEWFESRLLLFCLSDLLGANSHPSPLTLGLLGETPRSVAIMLPAIPSYGKPCALMSSPRLNPDINPAMATDGSNMLLLVGTNSGLVYIWELIRESNPHGTEGKMWKVGEPSHHVRVSSVAVDLIDIDGGVYAHSGSDAMFRRSRHCVSSLLGAGHDINGLRNSKGVKVKGTAADSQDQTEASLADACGLALEVCRVHGGSGIRAVCPVTTTSMPRGSMAWVGRDGRLLFGRLDPELKLRWTTAYIGVFHPHHKPPLSPPRKWLSICNSSLFANGYPPTHLSIHQWIIFRIIPVSNL